MTNDFDQIVENHFKKKRDIFGFESIAGLIEEVMSSMEEAGLPTVESRDPSLLTEGIKDFSAAKFFDTIYTPNITEEIGEIKDKNKTRQAFIRSMSGVGGKSLREKLNNVKRFMTEYDETRSVDEILSFVTFLKCMSEVFKDYSPSGSGFLLEAFLAGLMKGRQIIENSDETGGTLPIVDYEGGAGDPVSLKRLTGGKGKTPIKGSLKNLAQHISKFPDRGIDYVLAAVHADAAQVGFYEFNINIENFIYWVGKFIVIDSVQYKHALSAQADGAAEEASGEKPKKRVGKFKPGPEERDEEAAVADRFRKEVIKIQPALGVHPRFLEDAQVMADGDTAPNLTTSLAGRRELWNSSLPYVVAAAGYLKSQHKLLKSMYKHAEGISISNGPEWTGLEPDPAGVGHSGQLKIKQPHIDAALDVLVAGPSNEKEYEVASRILHHAFTKAVPQLSRISGRFSTGGFAYSKTPSEEAQAKAAERLDIAQAGTLAGLNDIEQQNFVAWAKANGPDFYKLVLSSAKGLDEKSQFSIPQEKVTFGGTSYFIEEITLDKPSIYKAINLYNKDIQARLMPVFVSVDKLMAQLQLLYTQNDLGAGQHASEECVELKGNVDAEITTRKEEEVLPQAAEE
jgi:hypothetical protein